ncbi:MAG: MFS transporter, partial [Promethearchaeota archaeon]
KATEIDRNKFNSNIWKLYLFHLFINFHLISGVLLPFLLTWGKLTFFEVMLLEAYYTFAIFVFEIPCGPVSDLISRKFSLFLAGIACAIAALIYSSYPNFYIFLIGETLWALGSALVSGTVTAITYDTLKKIGKEGQITKITARSNSFALIGIMISAPIGSILAIYIPIQYIVTLMSIPFLLATLFAILLKEPNHNLRKESQKYLEIIKSGYRELKNNKILRILAFDLIIIQTAAFFIIWIYQLYLEDLNVPIFFFGFVATGLTLTQIIFSNLISKFESNIKNKKRFLTLYSITPGIAYILLAFIFLTPISIMLLLIVVGFGFTRNIIFVNAINKQIETENRATVLSTISMFQCIIRAIIYPIIGILVMWSLYNTFIILGLTIIIFAIISPVKTEYLK